MYDNEIRVDVQRFADGEGGGGTVTGGAAPGADGGASSSAGAVTESSVENTIPSGSYAERHKVRQARMESLKAQIAARNAQPAETTEPEHTEEPDPEPTPEATPEPEKPKPLSFKERMKALRAECPAEFQAYFDEQFGSRHKDYKSIQETAARRQPVFDLLSRRYGTDDPDAIVKGIKESAKWSEQWQELADAEGLTIDQYLDKTLGDAEKARIKAENEQLKASLDQRAAQEDMDRRVQALAAEADALTAKYPHFNLSKELENADFQKYLRMGNGVEDSFLLTHHDTIANMAAQAAEKKVLDNIRARGQRPAESGMKPGAAVPARQAPSAMTRQERRKIAEQAMRGQNVKL